MHFFARRVVNRDVVLEQPQKHALQTRCCRCNGFLEHGLQWFVVALNSYRAAVDILMKLDAGKHDSQELLLNLGVSCLCISQSPRDEFDWFAIQKEA